MAQQKKPRKATKASFPTREELLTFISDAPGKVGKRDIAKAFNIKGSDRRELRELLFEMQKDGLLAGNRREIRRPGSLPPVTILELTEFDDEGYLIGQPTVWENDEGARPKVVLILPSGSTQNRTREANSEHTAGLGDRILARITPLEDGDDDTYRYSAAIIRKLPREKQRLLGIFTAHEKGGGEVRSVDRKSARDWTVQSGDEKDATDGDLVRFEPIRRGRSHVTRARVSEVLGNPSAQQQVSLIAIHAHSIPEDFPETVLHELKDLPPVSIDQRTDLRELPLITIDPADARDHDDAVHAEPDNDAGNPGGWIVTVAIADVAHYVAPHSRLDREAQRRGNSVYFPDRVVPMLPEEISNDLCSLREGEERPCLAVRMSFDKSGTKKSHTFLRAIMRSAAKLSYEEAQAAFNGTPGEKAAALQDSALTPLLRAYQSLTDARRRRAPLELELPERRIKIDATGQVERIIVPDRLDAHRLIEEFMIQANVAAAESLEKAKSPIIYRAHDQPSKEKLKSLRIFLETLSLKLPQQATLKPEAFNGILQATKELPVKDLVSEVVLRSQSQAEYTTENYGHFGLNLRRYAHFTSPIRRYADLTVHRALITALKLGGSGKDEEQMEELSGIAEHISGTERRAMAAERETVDRLIAHFLSDRIGAEFAGRISGVTSSGLFVRLAETGADGFVPASTLDDDYYHYVENQHALVGDRNNLAYRLGDQVEVRLVEAVPVAGALRFEMLSEGRKQHVSLTKGWRGKASSKGRPRLRGRPRRHR